MNVYSLPCPCTAPYPPRSPGVLSLPQACSRLGWALGPSFLVAFGALSMWTSFMLTEVGRGAAERSREGVGASALAAVRTCSRQFT